MNLKQETVKCLAAHGKTLDDIKLVCGDDFNISVENFTALADTEYDNGFGGQEVAKDLTLVGDGFVMIRTDYDGAEEWRYIDTHPREKTAAVNALEVRQACLRHQGLMSARYAETGDNKYLGYFDDLCSWSTLAEIAEYAAKTDC